MIHHKPQAICRSDGDSRRTFIKKGAGALAGLSYSGSLLGAGSMFAASGCATDEAVEPVVQSPVAHPLEGLTTLRSKEFQIPALFGNITLLDFWASWCAPCRQAFKHLDQLYRLYLPDGLQMVAVCVDEDPNEGLRFANRMRVRFPIAWDPTQSVKARFSVESLPTTFLLDANGRLVHRHTGFDLQSHRVLDEHVRRLVRGV